MNLNLPADFPQGDFACGEGTFACILKFSPLSKFSPAFWGRRRSRGIDTYAKHVCRRRRDGGLTHMRSMCVGVAESGARVVLVALRRARNLIPAFSFFVAFSFAAAMAKEKADRTHIFYFGG